MSEPSALREQITGAMIRVLAPDRMLLKPEEIRIVDELASAVLAVVLPHGKFLGDQLRDSEEQLLEARQWARHGYEIGQRHCGWTDHGVAPAWLTEGWPPHIESCEHLQQAAEYDEKLTQVRALCDDLRGVTGARYVADALDSILNGPATDPAAGPTVAEAAANDRRWPLEKHGE